MIKIRNILLILTAAAAIGMVSGCHTDDNGDKGGGTEQKATVETLTVEGLDNNQWVYISLETGRKVGTSKLGNKEEDAEWKARSDWDLAVCGELIRTNGGTSGIGQGSIQRIEGKSFNAIDEAPADGYVTDTDDIAVKR